MDYSSPLILGGCIQPIEVDGRPLFLLPAHRNTLKHDPTGDRDQFVLASRDLREWKLRATVPSRQPAVCFCTKGKSLLEVGPANC